MKHHLQKAVLAATVTVLSLSGFTKPVHADDGIPMWRLYNPNSGEHFYTASVDEREQLVDVGWRMEGVGWVAPSEGDDVYRLYNKNGGEHHYTTSQEERNNLISLGWRDEGVGWKSGGDIPLKREYNPNKFACNHNYTTSADEHNHLVSLGWRDEGTAWNAIGEGYQVAYNENAYFRKGFPPLSVCAQGLGRMNSNINDPVTNQEVDEQARKLVNLLRKDGIDLSTVNEYERSYYISQFVGDYFPYSLSTVKGVREMIETGTGDCWPQSELTLFMMRKMGISRCWFISRSVSSHHEVIAYLHDGTAYHWYNNLSEISEAEAHRLLGW